MAEKEHTHTRNRPRSDRFWRLGSTFKCHLNQMRHLNQFTKRDATPFPFWRCRKLNFSLWFRLTVSILFFFIQFALALAYADWMCLAVLAAPSFYDFKQFCVRGSACASKRSHFKQSTENRHPSERTNFIARSLVSTRAPLLKAKEVAQWVRARASEKRNKYKVGRCVFGNETFRLFSLSFFFFFRSFSSCHIRKFSFLLIVCGARRWIYFWQLKVFTLSPDRCVCCAACIVRFSLLAANHHHRFGASVSAEPAKMPFIP